MAIKKTRVTVSKAVRDAVLREFNHLCALCGAHSPQLHHIDEDPSNSDPENLLPLCANHHITDQHNPTARIDPGKLKLFRKYKDPVILGPQFHPVFQRFSFLLLVNDETDFSESSKCVHELGDFIAALKMGEYYSGRIRSLLAPAPSIWFSDEPASETARKHEEQRRSFISIMRANVSAVEALIVEMARYQDWQNPFPPEKTGISR